MLLDTRSEPGQIGSGDAHWDPFRVRTARRPLTVR